MSFWKAAPALLAGFILGLPFVSVSTATESPWSQSYELEAKGSYAQAAAVLEPLIGNGRESEFALLRYGWLNYLQRNYNDAIRAYQRALKLNPQSIDARLGLTLPLLAQQRWREAALYARQVLQRSPWNYIAHVRLMVSEEGQRKWKDLAAHAKEVAAHYPSDATSLVYLARAMVWLDEKEEARSAYRRVLDRIPNHVEANSYLRKK